MNCILAVDTASSIMSVCLKKGESYFEMSIDNGLKHSETLMNTILLVLEQAEVERKEIDLLICSEGPGSFTGLRIGMSTIKGLAFGLGIPYSAVITTDYLAYGFDHFDGLVIPLLDARKKRFYCSLYSNGIKIEGPLDISSDDLIKKTSSYKRVLLTGPDCQLISSDLRDGLFFDKNSRIPKGRQLMELGIQRYKKEGSLSDDYGPLYIRKSEAEIALYGEGN